MGLRGPNARPISDHTPALFDMDQAQRLQRFPWDAAELSRAARVAVFAESLPVTSGPLAGTRFRLLPWQRAAIDRIYATDEAGRRLVRQVLISMGRKGGKTGFVSVLALAHLCGPEAESRGQIVSAAVTREQSSLLHAEMSSAIAATPWLAARCSVRRFTKEIEDLQTGSIYRSLAADARAVHGLNPSVWLYDELAQASNRELLDALQTATGARAEPLGVVISTRSPDPHSPLEELITYARQVDDGLVEDRSFASFVFSAPSGCALDDEQAWRAANPGLDDGLPNIEELRASAAMAKRIASSAGNFRALRLNQPVAADARFIGPEDWLACAGEIADEHLVASPCYVGLDLSAIRDLTAAVAYWPETGAVRVRAWLPAEGLRDRGLQDRVPYDVWSERGYLTTIPGRVIDKRQVVRDVAEWLEPFDVRVVAFDRWGISEFKAAMESEGVTLPLEPHGQGYRDMSPSLDALDRSILAHALRHAGNPLLTWCIANVAIESDPAGNRKFAKQRATGRIDAAVALAMAVGTAVKVGGPAEVPSWVGMTLAI